MKFFLPLFLFSFIICSPAMADQKIVFVDMDRLVSVSKPGSSIFKQLKDINNKNLNLVDLSFAKSSVHNSQVDIRNNNEKSKYNHYN